MVVILRVKHGSEECKKAKLRELKKLEDFQSFKIVDTNRKALAITSSAVWM